MINTESMPNPYIPEPARIVRQYDLISDHKFMQVRHIDNKRATSFTYCPGQFMMVSVLGVGDAPFSLSSTPSRSGIIEFVVRKVGKVTEVLHEKRDNDIIYIRGPYGKGFDITGMLGKDILIVAGGLGVIPLRSIIYYILDNRDDFGKIFFLYGAKAPDEMLFKSELFQLKQREDIQCLYTVDEDPEGEWSENIGVVTNLFDYLPKIDPTNVSAVVCGPPVMYRFAARKLVELDIQKIQIQMNLERRMKCGIGKCGHCVLDHLYVCTDGPVFTYWDTIHFKELI